MESSTFNEKSIPKINEVFNFVLKNPYSNFYKDKYKNLGIKEIKSYEDFKKIPLLTKDEFLNVPIEKRTFVSEDKIGRYTISSGTTNARKPAIIPNFASGYGLTDKYKAADEHRKSCGARRLMILWPVSSSSFLNHISISKEYSRVIPGDISDLKLSAQIAKEIKIQGIVTTPTRLYFFINCLKEVDFNLKEIRWVSLGGEFCSRQKLAYFRSELPNSFMDITYGSSETGPIGYRCDILASGTEPNKFHPLTSVLIEVINEKGELAPLGESGEIAYTSLQARPFPLLRYKIGDVGTVAKCQCPCGNNHILTIGGRLGFDMLKFHGVTLYAELIANAINIAKEYAEPQFQMHVFEEKDVNSLKPRLELHLELKKEFKDMKNDMIFKETLKEKISQKLQLSSKATLKQLVEQNVFLPLKIVFLGSWPKDQAKSKNIISHLN